MRDDRPEESEPIGTARRWKIRFDSPPGLGARSQAEQGDILSLFRAHDQTVPDDRRRNPRYRPAQTHAWVGWWKGSRFAIALAELVNLSKGGALVLLPDRPPSAQPIWLCLRSPGPSDYVQARVLDAAIQPAGDYRARLEFHEPAPLGFFFAAGLRAEA
jgi:hypothetical protein